MVLLLPHLKDANDFLCAHNCVSVFFPCRSVWICVFVYTQRECVCKSVCIYRLIAYVSVRWCCNIELIVELLFELLVSNWFSCHSLFLLVFLSCMYLPEILYLELLLKRHFATNQLCHEVSVEHNFQHEKWDQDSRPLHNSPKHAAMAMDDRK